MEGRSDLGRVIVCRGYYATTPYYIAQIGKNLYSIEELCYYLCENAYLLDRDLMSTELVDWIDEELDFPILAKSLRSILKNNGALVQFVTTILEDIVYCTPEETLKVAQIIRENAKLDLNAKNKKKADFLVSGGMYQQAVREYEAILQNDRQKEETLTAAIFHNIGVCHARMFEFEEAASFYRKAYELNGSKESLMQYMLALKVSLPENAYRDQVISRQECVQIENEVNAVLNTVREEFEQSDRHQMLAEVTALAASGKMADYYQKQEQVVDELKEEFRRSRSE